LVPNSHAVSASSACTSTKNSDSAPDTMPATHVAPPSVVRANAPLRPPVHATSESTAARPRNSALLPVGCSTHWAAAADGWARASRREAIRRAVTPPEANERARIGATTASGASCTATDFPMRSLHRDGPWTRGAPHGRAGVRPPMYAGSVGKERAARCRRRRGASHARSARAPTPPARRAPRRTRRGTRSTPRRTSSDPWRCSGPASPGRATVPCARSPARAPAAAHVRRPGRRPARSAAPVLRGRTVRAGRPSAAPPRRSSCELVPRPPEQAHHQPDHEDDQRDLEGERQESGEHADEPDHGLEHHQADDGEDAAGRDLRYQPHGSLRANGWALRSDPPTAAGAGKIHEPAAAARREPSTPGSKQIRGRSRPEYATCVLPPLPRGNDSTPGRTDFRTGLARVAPVVHGPRRLGGNAWRRVDTTSNPGDDPIDPLAPHPRPRRSPGR